MDSWYFGKFTVTAFNFLYFNLLTGGSEFYGRNPVHWIISEGMPVVYTSMLPLLIFGIYKTRRSLHTISYLFALFMISTSPHKEYRFLLPYFPHAILILCRALPKISKKWLVLIVVLQVPLAVFLSFYHQVGALDTIDWLRYNQAEKVGFYINCHGTPFYSHIHRNITMHSLQCRPL